MKDSYLKNIVLAIIGIALGILLFLLTSLYWEHQAVVHHAARFEADSWGNVSFHWNDDSYAQTPFQDDECWHRIQANIFKQKLNALGIE